MKLKTTTIVLLLIVLFSNLKAQITIGAESPPIEGALLQLKQSDDQGANSSLGLLLPRVALTALTGNLATTLGKSDNYDNQSHIGLMVYNVAKDEESEATRRCPGIHIWAGDKWQPLIAYPSIEEQEIFDSYTDAEFIYLDPENTTDWRWGYIGKNPTDYSPLGKTVQITDNRTGDDLQQYYTTRYYVGYYRKVAKYNVKKSFSCKAGVSNFKDQPFISKIVDTFEEGVWMNQNLRTVVYDSQRDENGEATMTMTQTTDGNVTDPSLAQWGYPNKTAANKNTMGLLYTWAAATNGKGGTDGLAVGYELGVSEGKPIQGICPKGWHLPSDREWTDLENAIILKTSNFSSAVNDIGDSKKLTYFQVGGRGEHSPALRNTTSGTSDRIGISNAASNGGFDSYDSGFLSKGYVTYFDKAAGWWTSSFGSLSNPVSQRRMVMNVSDSDWMNARNVYRGPEARTVLHGVRCKKN